MNRALMTIVAIVVIGVVGFFIVTWRSSIAPVTPPDAGSFDAATVERGRVLASAGYCTSCHGADLAGGRGIESDFGTIYATNITPDADTGIGDYSEAAFARAIRKGVDRGGAHLFPAMPYNHFAKLTDEDVSALYAYVMTQPAVSADVPETKLNGIFGWRALQGGWKLLYVHGGAFKPDTSMSDAWNRGAYLAEGIGHCGACHTPRNGLGAEEGGAQTYAGALVDDWYAPALNGKPDAPLPWTEDELTAFLRDGGSPLHGVAAGSMAEVVHGLNALPDSDIEAMAVYFAEISGAPEMIPETEVADAMARPADDTLDPSLAHGAALYRSYCVSCHFNRPGMPSVTRPELSLDSVVTGPDPSNLIRVTLDGVSDADALPGVSMPGYKLIMTDSDIADIAAYARAAYASGAPAWGDLTDRVAELRNDDSD